MGASTGRRHAGIRVVASALCGAVLVVAIVIAFPGKAAAERWDACPPDPDAVAAAVAATGYTGLILSTNEIQSYYSSRGAGRSSAAIKDTLVNAEQLGYLWDCSIGGFAAPTAETEAVPTPAPAPAPSAPAPELAPTPAPARNPTPAPKIAPQPSLTAPTALPTTEVPDASSSVDSSALAAPVAAPSIPTTNYMPRFVLWLVAALAYYFGALYVIWRY